MLGRWGGVEGTNREEQERKTRATVWWKERGERNPAFIALGSCRVGS